MFVLHRLRHYLLDALRKLDLPTLVIRGDEDLLVRHIHGVIFARVIPDATLNTPNGVGHELPLGIMPETVRGILDHIRPIHVVP